VAYDERLAARISDLMHARPGVSERKMFGGIGWILQGHWAVGVMRTDQLLVRLPPEEIDEATRQPGVTAFGRPGAKPMKGFVLVDPGLLEDDAVLEDWVERGAARAMELPAK
jgi:hypothetical protein